MCMPARSPVTAGSDIEGCGTGVWDQGCTGVGYTGWVYGEGNTGYPASCSQGDPHQRSGPRKALQGPGVGGCGADAYPAARSVPSPPLRGPVGPYGPSLAGDLGMPPPGQ